MIIWMVVTKPFKDSLICISHTIAEFGFLVYTAFLFPFLSDTMASDTRLYIGSIIIWSIVALMVIVWIIFIINIIKIFVINRKLKKAKAKEELEKKELEEEEARLAKRRGSRKVPLEVEFLPSVEEIPVVIIYIIYINNI